MFFWFGETVSMQLRYEVVTVTFWMLKSNNVTTKFAPTQNAVLSELWHKNHCSFWTNLFEMAKYLVRVVAFSTLQKPPQREIHAVMYDDYCNGKYLQQNFPSLSNCFWDLSLPQSTVHTWYKAFHFGKVSFEVSDHPLTIATKLKCGQCEGSDQRRPTSYRKWDQAKREFQSFIRELGSDPPL